MRPRSYRALAARQILSPAFHIFRSLREECVWQHNFAAYAEASTAIGRWIRWYNEGRPHQALGYLSPHQNRTQELQAVA